MDVVHERCAGLDVHKKLVMVGVVVAVKGEEPHRETHTFGTMTIDLLDLSDWLMGLGVTHVAMESTGEYWKPIYNILENNFEIVLVDAQYLKAVSGRKTDVKDALVQMAHAAASIRNTYFTSQYHRLAGRRGKKRADLAVAHSILIIAYHMIKRREPYHELGGDYFDKRHPEVTARRLVKRLEQLILQVNVRLPIQTFA